MQKLSHGDASGALRLRNTQKPEGKHHGQPIFNLEIRLLRLKW